MYIWPEQHYQGEYESPNMSEADARIIIDDLLRQAGWDPTDKSQVKTEQKTDAGYADYVLCDRQGRALAVIEAKKAGIQPYQAKQQALPYAQSVKAPFIFLTNGELIYFWDYENEDARLIDTFYSQKDLERVVSLRREERPLAEIEIPKHYLRQSEPRDLRPYQIDTMKALDHALELGKRKFLIELPTGTGKTDLVCLYLKRLIEAGRADRILFLVDREQLAEQAHEAVVDLLGDEYSVYWRKSGIVQQEKQVTICLLQTMINTYQDYSSGYFDVVVADECHRSIYGAWSTALTRFDAIHIGLTATPAAYIERNTFKFYDCRENKPDFSYSIKDAIDKKFLVGYKFAEGVTHFIKDGADKDGEHYDPVEYWKKWTNADTDKKMMQKFDEMAWASYQSLAPGQRVGPGKTIIFAITKAHATRLAEILNDLHPEHKGNYAQVITSDVADPGELIRQFKKNDYPQIAVSVGMLDTGFDCREVLHLVMCRRVRSPILYQQMRGRGTRRADKIQKQGFVIYDFFRNHQYFDDAPTAIFEGPGTGTGGGGEGAKPKTPRELVELGLDDEWAEYVGYVEVGPEGERIDKKEYVVEWENAIRDEVEDDEVLQKVRSDQPLTEDEEEELANRLNKPRHFFNQENLRRAYGDQNKTIIDFIRTALGLVKTKTREERIIENFQAWLVAKKFTPEQAQYLSILKNRGIAQGQVDIDDLFKPPLSLLNAGGVGVQLFGDEGLKEVVGEMNESLFHKRAAGGKQ